MASTAYEKIPVPSYTSPTTTYTDPEILYSTAGFSQKGVTVKGGQGVLPAGTVLGQKTADHKYYAYNGGNGDGTGVARGILRRAVDTGAAGAPDQLTNIVVQGMVKLGMVQGLDAGAATALGGVSNTALGYFKF